MGNVGCCRDSGEIIDPGLYQDAAKADLSDSLHGANAVEAARLSAEKEKKKVQEKEAKEVEKNRKKAQKEAKEKADREKKAEEKRLAEEAEKRKQEEEEREQASRKERLGALGRPNAKLQVELETGWVDCSPDELKQVCDHVSGGGTQFPIQARGAMYFIDWSNPEMLTQKNVRSQKLRKLRVI